MRQLHDHEISDFNVDFIEVLVVDQPNDDIGGGANHRYRLLHKDRAGDTHGDATNIKFQEGPVKEVGVNGVSNEALLAVVIDRMRSFQRGPFSCRENALTLTNLEQAMMWQHKRTLDRVRRNVEGKHEV